MSQPNDQSAYPPAAYPAYGNGAPGYPAPGGASGYPAPGGAPGHPAPAGAVPAGPAPAYQASGAYPPPAGGAAYQQAPGGYPPPPYGHPAYPAPGQPFPAPGAAATQAPFPGTASGPMGSLTCRFCGCVPAAQVKFRGHQGIVYLMRFLSLEGPFCRDCGLATFRRMTSRTMWQGWYGIGSFVITPITVLMNVARRGKVADLPAPQPNPFGPSRQPMDPGKTIWERPLTYVGFVIPFAVLMLFVIAALTPDTY